MALPPSTRISLAPSVGVHFDAQQFRFGQRRPWRRAVVMLRRCVRQHRRLQTHQADVEARGRRCGAQTLGRGQLGQRRRDRHGEGDGSGHQMLAEHRQGGDEARRVYAYRFALGRVDHHRQVVAVLERRQFHGQGRQQLGPVGLGRLAQQRLGHGDVPRGQAGRTWNLQLGDELLRLGGRLQPPGRTRRRHDILARARLIIVVEGADRLIGARHLLGRRQRLAVGVAEEQERLGAPLAQIAARIQIVGIIVRQGRIAVALLLARPDVPDAVDIGVVQEEQRIDRRHIRLHEAVAVGGFAVGIGPDAADAVVHLVVRLTLHHAEAGDAAVELRLGAGEADEVARRQGVVEHPGRYSAVGYVVEPRPLRGRAARVGRREEHRPALGPNVEQQVGRETQAADQQLLILVVAKPGPELLQHRAEGVVEGVQALDVGGIVGIQHALEHLGRHLRIGRPVPVREGEAGVAAELAHDLLEPADIAAVPDHEPPVAVRAVDRVGQGVIVP
ncbi:conserved hypothetical protein, partial [Ricinus communis]